MLCACALALSCDISHSHHIRAKKQLGTDLYGIVPPTPKQGDAEGAKREYEKALKQTAGGQPNIAPLLGLATLAYNQGNFAAALGM